MSGLQGCCAAHPSVRVAPLSALCAHVCPSSLVPQQRPWVPAWSSSLDLRSSFSLIHLQTFMPSTPPLCAPQL